MHLQDYNTMDLLKMLLIAMIYIAINHFGCVGVPNTDAFMMFFKFDTETLISQGFSGRTYKVG